jgi:hypothetical protein
MSTVVEILRETEVTLPVSLVRVLEKALHRERRERQERQLREPLGRQEPSAHRVPGNRRPDPSLVNHGAARVGAHRPDMRPPDTRPLDAHRPDARPPDARSPGEGRPGSARDMDMARPMAVGVGRAHMTRGLGAPRPV